MRTVREFLTDERGTEMLEQIAILGFIVMPCLAILISFRATVTAKFASELRKSGL